MMKTIAVAALLALSTAQAADFFPLSPGNTWTYRAETGETFQINVGLTPIVLGNGNVYHKVTGYALKPLYVRSADHDVLYWLNEEFDREEILADFRPFTGGYYNTPLAGPCEGDAQTPETPARFENGGPIFRAAREIRYRLYGCFDVGTGHELYLDNIGMARRVVTTIAGPKVFNLTSAKIGQLTFHEQPSVQFRLSLPSSTLTRKIGDDRVNTEVTLRLQVDRTDALRLKYSTSQRYEIVLRDDRGEAVFRWSDGMAFLPVQSEELAVSKEYRVPLSFPLVDGQYDIEGWLTTDSPERKLAATARVTVVSAP